MNVAPRRLKRAAAILLSNPASAKLMPSAAAASGTKLVSTAQNAHAGRDVSKPQAAVQPRAAVRPLAAVRRSAAVHPLAAVQPRAAPVDLEVTAALPTQDRVAKSRRSKIVSAHKTPIAATIVGTTSAQIARLRAELTAAWSELGASALAAVHPRVDLGEAREVWELKPASHFSPAAAALVSAQNALTSLPNV